MPTNAINDTGVKYLYNKLHDEIEPVAEAVSDSEVTIEGNPLNFNTLSSQKSKSTILSVEPIQDLHGYDKPWVGGAGKNLYVGSPSFDGYTNISSYQIASETYNGHEVIYKSTTWSGAVYPITVQAGKTYTFSAMVKCSASQTVYAYGKTTLASKSIDNQWERISGSFTADETETINLRVEAGNPGITIYLSEYQLEEGSTATSYEPYENECPISGRSEIGILGCGKNLCNPDDMIAGYIDGTTGNINGQSTQRLEYTSDYIKIVGNIASARYVGYDSEEAPWICFGFYDVNKNFISRPREDDAVITTNIPSNAVYCRASMRTYGHGKEKCYISFIDTTYEPYQESNDLTISLGQTVYGGTLDVEKGILTVEKGYADLSTLSWTWQSSWEGWYTNITGIQRVGEGIPDLVSEKYEPLKFSDISQNHKIGIAVSGASDLVLVNDNSTTDAPTGAIAYKLATPITIQLTPNEISLLEGVNNISTDGDKITLTYRSGEVATLGDLTKVVEDTDSKIANAQILTDTETGDKYILVVTNGVLSVQQISN